MSRRGSTVPADSLDQCQIGTGVFDFVSHASFEDVISGALDGNLRVTHAFGKVLKLRSTAIHAAVVAGRKEVRVRVVADDPEINPEPGGPRRFGGEEVFRLRPGFRLGEIIGG
jgi:hypothetical protein